MKLVFYIIILLSLNKIVSEADEEPAEEAAGEGGEDGGEAAPAAEGEAAEGEGGEGEGGAAAEGDAAAAGEGEGDAAAEDGGDAAAEGDDDDDDEGDDGSGDIPYRSLPVLKPAPKLYFKNFTVYRIPLPKKHQFRKYFPYEKTSFFRYHINSTYQSSKKPSSSANATYDN